MEILKKLWQRLRSITLRTWALSGIVVVVGLVVLGGILYAWDYTNSPPFCGTVCHTMPPEYTAYLVSPHARVSCVECHIGRTFITNAFTRKAADLMHVVRYASQDYHFPLYAKGMQPAGESCEKCHWPQKFSDDTVRLRRAYETNEKNTAVTTLLTMKTGGGTRREGRGFGIHWHVENEVLFISRSSPGQEVSLDQEIPWVQVTDQNGKVTVYADVEKPLTPAEIASASKKRMDCITCHNRISHTFRSPEQVINQALANRQLDERTPFIAQKSAELLKAEYKSADEANKAIAALEGFYKDKYPAYYQTNAETVRSSVAFLTEAYKTIVYPTQDLSWTTHPDNIGHKTSPGCFRCHDGKHFAADNTQGIRLECNICHSLPQVYRAGEPAPAISTARATEPDSHAKTTWLAEHRFVYDTSCQQCHDTRNAGGNDNSSFCSNSACHGVKWTYAGLNAPGLAKVFPVPQPQPPKPGASAPTIPHPIGGRPDCLICHGQKSVAKPAPTSHANITIDLCQNCHKAAIPPPAGEEPVTHGPPNVPHELAGRAECLGCHGTGTAGITQVPKFHLDFKFPNGTCTSCHAVKPVPGGGGALGPSLPADHAGRTLCNVCHEQGQFGAKKFPASHAGRSDTTCSTCHKPK